MDLIEFMKLLELMLKLNRLALQILNLELFHYSKFQSVRATFQQTSFGMVTTYLDLESKRQSESKILGCQQLQLPTIVT